MYCWSFQIYNNKFFSVTFFVRFKNVQFTQKLLKFKSTFRISFYVKALISTFFCLDNTNQFIFRTKAAQYDKLDKLFDKPRLDWTLRNKTLKNNVYIEKDGRKKFKN